MARASSVVDRTLLKGIPHATGVYVMRDANDRVIYVGKAKDLRERVGTYFSQPLGYTRKMDGLIEALAHIEVEVVGSELEARNSWRIGDRVASRSRSRMPAFLARSRQQANSPGLVSANIANALRSA